MNYVFQFNIVWDHLPELLEGALLTIQLSATAMALGLCLAVACAYGNSAGPRPVRWLVAAYVELIRNTPFLVQIYFIFFALPLAGLRTIQRWRGLKPEQHAEQEISVPAAPINALLTGLLLLESRWIRRFNIPAGSSLICLARKPA